jgi:hypothetical protein
LIYNPLTIVKISFWFCECNFKILGAYKTLLERYFQDLSGGGLKAFRFY